MFIGDSATAAFPARGAVFFRACGVPAACLRRACGVPAARVGAAVSVRMAVPGKARQCPAMPRGTPHGETAGQNPPQPSGAHGAARKLPDVKNIFI